jgi:DNA modification methylase
MNTLYFGDNLDILREYVADESVDLIYLDPPFNSQAQYNVLFKSPKEDAASAQVEAFRDTWAWGNEAEFAFAEIMRGGGKTARIVDALRSALGESDMMAYLAMMAVRLQELWRVTRPTGTIYLHCDPTACHYLRVLLDGIFGPQNFLSQVAWQRTGTHSSAKRWGPIHDVILFYGKHNAAPRVWNRPYAPLSEKHLKGHYRKVDEAGRRYEHGELTAPGIRRGRSGEVWRGFDVTSIGRHWTTTVDRLEQLYAEGRIYLPADGAWPRMIRYMDESKGKAIGDVWTDIPPINMRARERLGYPTQKPLALLERIVSASSNPGDVILDPFCGCGTTIEAAHRSGRQWVGIDVAIHAIKVIEARLSEHLPDASYRIEGIPRDFESAVRLAERDKYQFQWWANYLFDPHALREQKRGADRGIDGELFFPNGPGRPWGRMLTSVKGGANVGPAMVRDFRGVLEREQAEMGLFICLYAPTNAMRAEAAAARIADTVHGPIPRLQIVAIEDWFAGRLPKLPPLEHLPSAAFATAKRRRPAKSKRPDPAQPQLPLSFIGDKADDRNVVRHLNPALVAAE